MKKLMVFGTSIFAFFFLLNCIFAVSAVRINEMELNPTGTDAGNEWVELYSEQEVSLSGWKLVNSDNQVVELNVHFQGYFIINFSGQWLDNSEERLVLKNALGNTEDETTAFSDSKNDDKTVQYCSGGWVLKSQTKGASNSCDSTSVNQSQNTSKNSSVNPFGPAISLELSWEEDEILNGKEFEIEIKVNNLKNENYDVKIYIAQASNDIVISENYNEKENAWVYGNYYLDSILSGPGNKSMTLSLRIRDKFENFTGSAKIGFKIRNAGTSSIAAETEKNIVILEKEEKKTTLVTNKSTKDKNLEVPRSTESTITKQADGVIRLGSKNKIPLSPKVMEDAKEEPKAKVLYESATAKVKKYALYAMNLLLIGIVIFLLVTKGKALKNKKSMKE